MRALRYTGLILTLTGALLFTPTARANAEDKGLVALSFNVKDAPDDFTLYVTYHSLTDSSNGEEVSDVFTIKESDLTSEGFYTVSSYVPVGEYAIDGMNFKYGYDLSYSMNKDAFKVTGEDITELSGIVTYIDSEASSYANTKRAEEQGETVSANENENAFSDESASSENGKKEKTTKSVSLSTDDEEETPTIKSSTKDAFIDFLLNSWWVFLIFAIGCIFFVKKKKDMRDDV